MRGTHKLKTTREGASQETERKQPSEGTHFLETTETIPDMERKRPGEGYSQTGDSTGRDKSGHAKKVTEQGALAS